MRVWGRGVSVRDIQKLTAGHRGGGERGWQVACGLWRAGRSPEGEGWVPLLAVCLLFEAPFPFYCEMIFCPVTLFYCQGKRQSYRPSK